MSLVWCCLVEISDPYLLLLVSQYRGGDGGRIADNLYAAWAAAWWLTLVSIAINLGRLADLIGDETWSYTNHTLGLVIRYGAHLLLTIGTALLL